MRCLHEAQLHPDNSMITLTYDDQHIPTNYSVDKREWQLFMKRLRKSLEPKKIRFFACGEYGDLTLRPHYHSIIFGHAFPDKKLHAIRRGKRYYKSDALNELWPSGQLNEITDVTYASAAYVARYVMKKINGDTADDHYTRVSPIDGQVYRVQPEFCLGSRRPGLASKWFEKFEADCFPDDFCVVEGKRHPVPRYYLQKLEEARQVKIKRKRKRASFAHRANNTKERLAVREIVQLEKATRLKRIL